MHGADKDLYQWQNTTSSVKTDETESVTQSAKIFVAETISQDNNGADANKVRKISIAAAEFITIENQENKGKETCDDRNSAGESNCLIRTKLKSFFFFSA